MSTHVHSAIQIIFAALLNSVIVLLNDVYESVDTASHFTQAGVHTQAEFFNLTFHEEIIFPFQSVKSPDN